MIANRAASTPVPNRRTPVGGVVLLVVGVLLALAGAATVAGGIAATTAVVAQQRYGYVDSPSTPLAPDGFALTTPSTSASKGGTIPRLPA